MKASCVLNVKQIIKFGKNQNKKTMNTQSFIKRIAFACTKSGQLNKRYETAINIIDVMSQNKTYHPLRWVKNGRHFGASGENNVRKLKELCKALGIELLWGNDAPRGGMDGDYVYLNKKDIQKLKTVDFSVIIK